MTVNDSAAPPTSLDVDQALAQAIAHHGEARLEAASGLYRAILEARPGHSDANHNLGVIALQLGRPLEALPLLKAALEANTRSERFWLTYIEALIRAGRVDSACGVLDQARGFGVQGPEADRLAARLAAVAPGNADRLALIALFEQKQLGQVETQAREMAGRYPNHPFAWKVLGATLRELGRREQGEAALRRASALAPEDPEALTSLGNALRDLDRLVESEACHRRAIELKPDLAVAHSNLGYVLWDQRRLVESEAACRRAIELKPDLTAAHSNLGNALGYQSRLAEGCDSARRALELEPDSDSFWEKYLYVVSYHPDLPAEAIFKEFVRWGDRFPDPVTDFSGHDRTAGRRLRIGYVSPDFRKHTSRFYFMPLFEGHDREAFELFAYSNVRDEDAETADFKAVFDHWRNIRGVSDEAAAALVREDRIDILVDGCGHMRDDRLGLFALKPAPVQVTWLGSAWTTGLKAIDYVLFDPHIAPEGTLAREKIVRVPDCFVAYRPPGTKVGLAPPPMLKNGYPTFAYSGRTERLNPHTFRVWSEILRRLPDARLILDFAPFADPETQAYYRTVLEGHGFDLERVIMRRSTDIFTGLNDFDILLDSFPHSGGTMLFDALWMGVPAVTLKARPPLGRIGTTLMTNLGLADWAVDSEEAYIQKAVEAVSDPKALAKLRAGFRKRMKTSPIMDEAAFARGVDAAYRTMWETWRTAP